MKTTYANGDVYSAADVNDITGTINLLQTSTLSNSAGKNFLINGAQEIWQRGTSFSMAASTFVYTSDRWYVGVNINQASTISRQTTSDTTNLPSIQYCSRVQRNSGQTGINDIVISQSIESINSIPMAGKTVTLSFYARKGANYSATSDLITSKIQSGTGTDQNVLSGFTGQANVVTGSHTLTANWQRFSITGTVGSTATQLAASVVYTPTGTAGAADYFEVTGVQLELGSTPTTFSRAGSTLGGELALCQRYLPAVVINDISTGYSNTTTTSFIPFQFPVTARIAPTGIIVQNLSNFLLYNGSIVSGIPTSIVFNVSGTNAGAVIVTTTAGSPTLTIGQGAILQPTNNAAAPIILWTGSEL
jgi:hypothetical protein